MGSSSVQCALDSKLKRELGPLIMAALEADGTEDVMLCADMSLWVKKGGAAYQRLGEMTIENATGACGTAAAMCGSEINHERPILETQIFDRYRIECLVPPVTQAPVFSIRVPSRRVYALDQYRSSGIISDAHFLALTSAIYDRKSIVTVGGTASGKTSLLNALLLQIAHTQPHERLVLIEDTPELRCASQNYVSLRTVDSGSHQVSALECLKATLRLRPDRIIVGEVRDKAAYMLLNAWNTGHPGGLATVHANSALLGLARLEHLVAEDPDARGQDQREYIAQAVNVVVFIDLADGGAGRKVREVMVVNGWKDGQYDVHFV